MSAPRYSREEWEKLHPWPAELDAGKRLEFLWSFSSPASPEEVWQLLSDTSRVNRSLGGPVFRYQETPEGVLNGSAIYGGIRHEWRELPWSWVAGRWAEGARIFSRGAMRALRHIRHIDPAPGGGSLAHVCFQVVPRFSIAALPLRLTFAAFENQYAQLIAGIRPGASAPLTVAPGPLGERGEARLAAVTKVLRERGFDAALVERVAAWVREGDELDLARIQVRERARAWGVDEHRLLALFLHATRAGLFDLSWDVVCPHCRGVREESANVAGIPRRGDCPVCAVTFDTADAVEITFHVHPSVRPIVKRIYCAAEPATKSHVRVQQRLLPGAQREVPIELGAGRWRLRQVGQESYGYLAAGEAGPDALTWKSTEPPGERNAGRAAALRLINDGPAPATFVIETPTWSDSVLRPGQLLSFQEFRDLFSDEYLGADMQLAVGEQTILFTDIVGSTALYARRGDPEAFVEVKRHFDRVFRIIAESRGAVVKTIGDAAMGAFGDPLDAVRASKLIHQAFPAPAPGEPAGTRLRISLNSGPCIAVKLNANIDYFGGAVNVAAKLQSLAEASQVAISLRTWEAAGVAEWVAAQGGPVVDMEYRSAALREPVKVKQWTVP